jgi:hypothetical protein
VLADNLTADSLVHASIWLNHHCCTHHWSCLKRAPDGRVDPRGFHHGTPVLRFTTVRNTHQGTDDV